jgi:hypothetical protein
MTCKATPISTKRTFSILSPESPDSIIKQDTKRPNLSMDLELPADTPDWARVFTKLLSSKMDTIEQGLGASVEYLSDQVTKNSTSITKIKSESQIVHLELNSLKQENEVLRERLVKMEAQTRRKFAIFGVQRNTR